MLRGVLLRGPEQKASGEACAHISALFHTHLLGKFILFLYISVIFSIGIVVP